MLWKLLNLWPIDVYFFFTVLEFFILLSLENWVFKLRQRLINLLLNFLLLFKFHNSYLLVWSINILNILLNLVYLFYSFIALLAISSSALKLTLDVVFFILLFSQNVFFIEVLLLKLPFKSLNLNC